MELAEPVERINKELAYIFGIDTVTGQPIWRVVWSNDQYEKRMTQYTTEGLELLYPEVRLLPKYQHIRDRWVLERLVLVPEISQEEMADKKISYEPLWTFEGQKGEYLPPRFDACEYIINLVYRAQGIKSNVAKYKKTNEEEKEEKAQRVDKIKNELFGDNSGLNGETINASGSSIIVP